jgi:hypothetical protein
MNTLYALLLFPVVSPVLLSTTGQGSVMSVPSIFADIRQEAQAAAAQPGGSQFESLWEPAAAIARKYDRSAIDAIFKSAAYLDSLPDNVTTHWSRPLTAYVLVQIADPEDQCGLKAILTRTISTDLTEEALRTVAMVAIDHYHDEASRKWLTDVAFSGDDQSYFALQLLRGYAASNASRARLDQALQGDTSKIEIAAGWRGFTRGDTLRSVLESWDFAARLDDPASRARYRKFQSRLWQLHATLAVSRRGKRNASFQFDGTANQLADEWRPGDERFVLYVFQNPHTTPDEARIAVYLAHKLTDTAPLKAIAESDSPQAPYAREALQHIERQRQRDQPAK